MLVRGKSSKSPSGAGAATEAGGGVGGRGAVDAGAAGVGGGGA